MLCQKQQSCIYNHVPLPRKPRFLRTSDVCSSGRAEEEDAGRALSGRAEAAGVIGRRLARLNTCLDSLVNLHILITCKKKERQKDE